MWQNKAWHSTKCINFFFCIGSTISLGDILKEKQEKRQKKSWYVHGLFLQIFITILATYLSLSYFTLIFQWRCVVRLVVNKRIWSYSLVINLFVYVFVCLFVYLFWWKLLIYSSFHLRQEREQAIREFLNEPARKISRYVKPAFSNSSSYLVWVS